MSPFLLRRIVAYWSLAAKRVALDYAPPGAFVFGRVAACAGQGAKPRRAPGFLLPLILGRLRWLWASALAGSPSVGCAVKQRRASGTSQGRVSARFSGLP